MVGNTVKAKKSKKKSDSGKLFNDFKSRRKDRDPEGMIAALKNHELSMLTSETDDSKSSSTIEMPRPKKIKLEAPNPAESDSIDAAQFESSDLSSWEKSRSIKEMVTESEDCESSCDTKPPLAKNITLDDRSFKDSNSGNVSQNNSPNALFHDETPNFKKMSWLDKLKHKYPALQEQSHTNISFPGTDVKYSILLVPKHIDFQNLSNLKTKHFTKGKTVKVNNKEFICEVLPVKPDPVIVAFTAPKLIEPQSTYCLRECLPPLTPLSELKSPEPEGVALPTQIKNQRHPLFGGNYKNKMKLSEEVCRQLQEAVERKSKVEKKERKRCKVKKNHSSRGVEENVLNIFNSIDTAFKNSTVLANSEAESLYNSKSNLKRHNNFNIEHKSKKRKRKDLDATLEDLDFTVLEENDKKRKSN
ncbi:uncharacterized protein [Euwallacea fornicatus]